MAEPSPKSENPKVMSIPRFLLALYSYLEPYRFQTLLLLFLLLVNLAFTMGWPLSFRYLIDKGITQHNETVLAYTLIGLLLGVIIASAAGVGRGYCYAYLSSQVIRDIRLKVFGHLQQLSMAYYFRNRTGDIMARFSSDLAAMETALTWATASLIMNAASVLLGIILLFLLEWRLAFLTLTGLVICVLSPRRLAKRTAAMSYDVKQKEALLTQLVQENILAQSVVKAFGLRPIVTEDFNREASELGTMTLRFSFSADNVERIPTIIILVFEILVIGAGVLLVFNNSLTLGTLVALHTLFIHISFSVEAVTKVIPYMLRSVGGLQRIEELLAEEPDVAESKGAKDLQRLSTAVVFDDVTFGYGNGQPVLNHVSFQIPKKSFVSFVGPSGCGKSTIINLLLRFYDPQEGAVIFDGTNASIAKSDSLRSQIGVVFQESFLFNISIRENIRMGRPHASDADVEQAAKAAGVHEAILSLPEEYDTIAGERGMRLSGGQRQRIAIARALIRDPEILVLDEATSALDPDAEASINQTLMEVAKGRTMVSVTHRLSSVKEADCIFLLQNGALREFGKHEDLLARGGLYSHLWQKQSGFSFNEGGAQVDPERLKRYPILEQLDSELLAELATLFVTESYPADRVVVREGYTGNRFYLIARGRVSVHKTNAAGIEEKVAQLDDGDYFGEIALIKNIPRTATIRTITSCVLLSLHREHFRNLLDRAPHIREKLEMTLHQREDN